MNKLYAYLFLITAIILTGEISQASAKMCSLSKANKENVRPAAKAQLAAALALPPHTAFNSHATKKSSIESIKPFPIEEIRRLFAAHQNNTQQIVQPSNRYNPSVSLSPGSDFSTPQSQSTSSSSDKKTKRSPLAGKKRKANAVQEPPALEEVSPLAALPAATGVEAAQRQTSSSDSDGTPTAGMTPYANRQKQAGSTPMASPPRPKPSKKVRTLAKALQALQEDSPQNSQEIGDAQKRAQEKEAADNIKKKDTPAAYIEPHHEVDAYPQRIADLHHRDLLIVLKSHLISIKRSMDNISVESTRQFFVLTADKIDWYACVLSIRGFIQWIYKNEDSLESLLLDPRNAQEVAELQPLMSAILGVFKNLFIAFESKLHQIVVGSESKWIQIANRIYGQLELLTNKRSLTPLFPSNFEQLLQEIKNKKLAIAETLESTSTI